MKAYLSKVFKADCPTCNRIGWLWHVGKRCEVLVLQRTGCLDTFTVWP